MDVPNDLAKIKKLLTTDTLLNSRIKRIEEQIIALCRILKVSPKDLTKEIHNEIENTKFQRELTIGEIEFMKPFLDTDTMNQIEKAFKEADEDLNKIDKKMN